MNWLKKNNYIILLLGVFLLLFVVYTWETPNDLTYEKIKVEHGDSLWSLAEKYKGNMATDKWMEIVMIENNMDDVSIIAGKPLVIPVTEKTNLFTGDTVEIARDSK